MPRGCVIHIPQIPYSHWCIPTPLAVGTVGAQYISAWGFGVARFDRHGNSYEPQGVERATVSGFTLFCIDYSGTEVLPGSKTLFTS